ncbi:LysR family transcriptional regulator [Streptomyces sp. NPDC053750]|uniref:LysR family transcriptional regulator n=1 Tax=Streptomyces sp. NPDC053750 TaxID=3365714 RepID=UPI0037D68EB4
MTSRLTVEDLTLTETVARHGSVGAAAKELLTTQPSASRRLAALERRLGVRLFERDTTGARPTPAGRELARQAARLLADIDALPDQVLAATSAASLSVGTIQALAPMVFTALSVELDHVTVHPEIDHGPVLLQQVHDGLLDAAIVTIADQTTVPRGLHRTAMGVSPLVLVLPDGAPALGKGARPLAGRPVLYSTFDRTGETVRQRLSALGARPLPAPTIEAGLRIARHRRSCALVPELAARWYPAPGDRIQSSPVPGQVALSLVTRPPGSPVPADALERITARVLGAGQAEQSARVAGPSPRSVR